jgi:hypothetical protein
MKMGISATSQQYFTLRTNQPPATSQQYFSLRTNQHQPSATSQTNRPWLMNLELPAMQYISEIQVHRFIYFALEALFDTHVYRDRDRTHQVDQLLLAT